MERANVIDINYSFEEERKHRITKNLMNVEFQNLSAKWVECAMRNDYVYNFDWLGRPIIQFPTDIVAVQDLIYKIRPDLIIETGIAHGGSLILSASILALLDLEDAILEGSAMDPSESKRRVLGVDIEIRKHNLEEIKKHFLSSRIELLEASSTLASTIELVKVFASKYQTVMVFLDSNHTYKHVIDELNSYAPLVTKGSYCVVFDTFVENVPKDVFQDRPWGPSNNPMTAVKDFLETNKDFKIDSDIESKLMITVAPSGFLKRIQ
jgi:cephalosporin hydroxylase